MKLAVSLLVAWSLAVMDCNKNDSQPAAAEGAGGPTAGETAPPPAADRLEFFGYWIGMPWDEFLGRARKAHGFELGPRYGGGDTSEAAEGRGTIAGVAVEGRFAAAGGKLAEFHVFHVTTEPVPLTEMPLYGALMQSVGRAEGGCSGGASDMHCRWSAGGASLTLGKTEAWPKDAPAMEHEYSVRAALDAPARDTTAEDLARRESEVAQKKREELIKQAILIADQVQLSSKGKLKPTASDCLWRLNNEDPLKALEVAQCMIKAEVYNDLRACSDPCRPPDPSLAK